MAFGYPDPFVRLIQAMHDDMTARAIHQGAESEEFSMSYGLKQGCVGPDFVLSLPGCIAHEIPPDNPGVDVNSRFDGSLFNLTPTLQCDGTTVCK